jgi:hypothetical protein
MRIVFLAFLFFSTASFSLTPLLDSDMSVVSGQSGITIDTQISSPLTIAEFRFEDNDGNSELEEGGSISMRDIWVKDGAFSIDFDITNEGEMIVELNRFATTDMSIGAIQFNYDASLSAINPLLASTDAQLSNQYSRLGSLFIHDYTLDPTADITFKASIEGDFLFTAGLPTGSFFYLTYTDDGDFTYDTNNDGDTTKNDTSGNNYISARVEFDGFRINDISFKGVGIGSDSYLDIRLGGTEGTIAFTDININGSVIGSSGFENIQVNPVSYLQIKGH